MALGVIKTLAREIGRSWLAYAEPRNARFEISCSAFLLLVFFFLFLSKALGFVWTLPQRGSNLFFPVQSGEINAYALSALPRRMEAELLNKILPFFLKKKKRRKS